MLQVFLLPLWLVGAFILYKLTTTLLTHRRNARSAQRQGCKPLPSLPSPDPLGIINIVRLIQANTAGKFPDFINQRTVALSAQEARPVFTYQLHLMRNWLIFTCDPKNIQAVLATQFKDFELGPVRSGTFAPLLVFLSVWFLLAAGWLIRATGWDVVSSPRMGSSGNTRALCCGPNSCESKSATWNWRNGICRI
jgi:hypothetical protein